MARATPLLLLPLLLRAQSPPKEVSIRTHPYVPPSAILRAEANLVEAGLTVRDSQGHAIAGLRASDFEVLDNGVVQKITAFSELRTDGTRAEPASSTSAKEVPAATLPPPAPKFVTFFFDDAHLSNADMLFAVRGAHRFISNGMKPSDWMSIVTTSGQGDLDFTNDASLFDSKLDKLASHMRPAIPFGCGAVSPEESYIVVHHLDYQVIEKAIGLAKVCACGDGEKESVCRPKASAVAEGTANTSWEQTQAESINTVFALGFAAKKLHEVNGTRILVLTSAGFLVRARQPEMERFIDGAVHWNITIHALDAKGLNPIRGGAESRISALLQANSWTPLEQLTAGTGGHFFKNTNDLAGAMDLAAHPEVTYLLAFNPGPHDGTFHTLKIRFKTKRPESVQFRPGYDSPRDEPRKEQTARERLDAAVFSHETLREIPAAVNVSSGPESVSVTITVDRIQLRFTTGNGRHAQQIVFLMTLLDPNGAFVIGKEAIMDLALTDEKLKSLQKDGLKAVATLTAPAGKYEVRTIVREAMKGSLAATTIPIDLK